MNSLSGSGTEVDVTTQDWQDFMVWQEVKQEMNSHEDQLGCSQRSETPTDAKSLNVPEEFWKNEQLFGCGKCLAYFKGSDLAKTCFYSHTEKKVVCVATHSKVIADNTRKSVYKPLLCNVSDDILVVPSSTAERSFICQLCNKNYCRSSELKRHMCTHTSERRFKCEVCDKAFSQCGHLKNHKTIHTGDQPFICQMCDVAFSLSHNLKRHMRIHAGERPYRCEICGAAFSQSGNLKKHKNVHTDERSFKCEACCAAFSYYGSLKKHKTIHKK